MQDNKKVQQFILQEKVGYGAFGDVYKAIDENTSEVFAIKRIFSGRSQQIDQSTIREISALSSLKGQNHIVPLQKVIFEKGCVYIVLPFYPYNLYEHIKKNSEINYKKIFKQLLLGVYNIHKLGFMHRDLKPLNILVDEKQNVYISDFGIARMNFGQCRNFNSNCEKHSYEVITLHFRPPENLLGCDNYHVSVDVWSLGCVFYQVVMKEILFYGDSQIEMLFKIFSKLGTPSAFIAPSLCGLPLFNAAAFPRFYPTKYLFQQELLSKIGYEGADLIDRMIQLEPSRRITMSEALQHQYFL
ncbi:unnamed protein product (macronuclear) [Paramecium tetraurelia]|uniref:Cyclin-dependent kinase 2 homolog n=1 Tax=Paramecium tetraurelia TaxID=5888 RepID=A0C524_PARTE|nr:uncharacterized protein GSPATT00006390001 [Paramecium tetraurelia]CAK65891.1 unnamed protein product [Paramecium tetraurelia]|eukprot:XP_001433288.1 hypothetical protein (macronuclear) [Paramecium tetraurelia strain d4-2]